MFTMNFDSQSPKGLVHTSRTGTTGMAVGILSAVSSLHCLSMPVMSH